MNDLTDRWNKISEWLGSWLANFYDNLSRGMAIVYDNLAKLVFWFIKS